MNWDAIGAIAELAGAIGVIASLLYLTGQVRASTRASTVDAKLATTGFLNKFIESLIENPDLKIRAVLHYWLRGAGCRAWWEKMGRESMSPIFREYVEAEIRQVNLS